MSETARVLSMWALAACLVLLPAIAPFEAAAQSRGDRPMLLVEPASVARLDQARKLLFKLDQPDADRALYELARTRDGEVAAYYHLALGSLIVALLTDRPEAFARFFERSDSLRKLVDRAPRGDWRDLLDAETDFLRSVAWAKRGQYVRAAMASTSAFRSYRKVISHAPGLADARKGSGLFEAAVGALPEFYRRFLTIFGFPADFERGAADLFAAARGGGYLADEASLYLGIFGLYDLPVPVDPMAELASLYARHGGSPVTALPYLELLFKKRQVATADSVLLDMRRLNAHGRLTRVEYFTWFEGESAFRREQYEESAALFTRYVDDHAGPALKTSARLRIGLANDMIGRRERAVEAYRHIVVLREYESDAAGARWAARLLAAPPSSHEKSLIRASNAFDRNDLATADSMLTALRASADLPEGLRAEVMYRSGRLAETRDGPVEALAFFRAATAARGDTRDRWAPMSWLRIAVLEEERGRKDSAILALDRFLDIPTPFDYHGQLRQQAQVRLDRLRAARPDPRPR